MRDSDYIVYVDESGDHGLDSINSHYPVFVLAYCIFEKESYRLESTPALQGFKFTHFGHDMVILHERDIRKAEGEFTFLVDPVRREAFMKDLSNLVAESEFTVIATVVNKHELRSRYVYPENPYHLALAYGLERVQLFLEQRGQGERRTHLIFERRGKREDEALELEFRRVCSGANYKKQKLRSKSSPEKQKAPVFTEAPLPTGIPQSRRNYSLLWRFCQWFQRFLTALLGSRCPLGQQDPQVEEDPQPER